jgi:hypothetical protein
MIFRLIDQDKAPDAVSLLCRVLGVARGLLRLDAAAAKRSGSHRRRRWD